MSQLISKTDLVVESGALHETHLNITRDKYCLYELIQHLNGMAPAERGQETIYLNRDQAITIAKTILRNEGYSIE